MVQDLVHNLCESLVTNIGGIADTGKRTPPVPIIFLTQWRMMGNSVVHTDEYLTQWKVEGNSVVDNNTILSCGDLGQDGKYHVKISNGVDVYDIALDEPLRKVNDVADTIEFANGNAVLTRKIRRTTLDSFSWTFFPATNRWGCYTTDIKPASSWRKAANILCAIYNTCSDQMISEGTVGICMLTSERMMIRDSNYTDSSDQTDFEAHIQGVELIYEKITPTTEVIQVSPFPVSPTDTYTSANDTPYSAFEYKKNVEIWSCGEYNAVDSKYHILVQPLGGSIADIALDEPLRKVNNVADSIEFADGVATLTRKFGSVDMYILPWTIQTDGLFRCMSNDYVDSMKYLTRNLLNIRYTAVVGTPTSDLSIAVTNSQTMPILRVKDTNYTDVDTYKNSLQGVELIFELATPTTETIQVPQIQKADSYSCVISQGGKAVSWSSFGTT